MQEIEKRRLVIRAFHIDKVELGSKFKLDKGLLSIDNLISNELSMLEDVIKSVNIKIIKPKEHDIFINSIMDILPISTKVLGVLGEGITHTLTGVRVMLTGADEDGLQMAEFGSSEGILSNQIVLNRAGTPTKDDYIIHVDITLKGKIGLKRELPTACHKVCDIFIQKIRNILKQVEAKNANEVHEYFDVIRPEGKKVLIIKQIAGQGAMYDNQLFPDEPSGFAGGKSIIDLGNMPIILTPNEYRDGALRAMT